MPFPIIAALPALAAGTATLVPHAAGGWIVTGSAGYMAGTYITAGSVAAAIASVGGLGAAIATATSASMGSLGFMGTTIGATGIKGALASAGLIASTPIWVAAAKLAGITIGASGGLWFARLAHKIHKARHGKSVVFTKRETGLISWMLVNLFNRGLLK